MNVTSRRMRRAAQIVSATAAAGLIAGCSSTIEGTPRAEGAFSSGDNGEFTALLEECNAVSEDQIAQTVGALAISRGFFGAICRWDTIGADGPGKVTFNWFETGSLDTEQSTGEKLGYAVESSTVQGRRSVVMRPPEDPGSCGVTVGSPSGGVVGWWVQFKNGAMDPCDAASTLANMTVNRSI
ncbi:DUF3558 domain-containing protein [Rhodococcus sp. NPDC049939]|uniref:DUF3558 domain-containing protein n=1 Tax=Rhodococcus sp. NPDC049939 TaxID=3155511 RepID=UPI0033DAEA9A